jgi:hypothetical protein
MRSHAADHGILPWIGGLTDLGDGWLPTLRGAGDVRAARLHPRWRKANYAAVLLTFRFYAETAGAIPLLQLACARCSINGSPQGDTGTGILANQPPLLMIGKSIADIDPIPGALSVSVHLRLRAQFAPVDRAAGEERRRNKCIGIASNCENRSRVLLRTSKNLRLGARAQQKADPEDPHVTTT